MCCRRKQQGGWGLLACESWAVHRVEAIEGGVVSCFSYTYDVCSNLGVSK